MEPQLPIDDMLPNVYMLKMELASLCEAVYHCVVSALQSVAAADLHVPKNVPKVA